MDIAEEIIEKAYDAYWRSRGNNLVKTRAAIVSAAPEIRRAAMEEAAKIADAIIAKMHETKNHISANGATLTAAAIRALAEKDAAT